MGKLLLIPALIVLAACTTTGRPDSGRRAEETASTPGRATYERSCQRCHALYMPRSYAAGEWRFFVRKYGRKARLSRSQREEVLGYLTAHARGAAPRG